MEVAALGLRIDGIGNIDQASTSLGRFTQSADSAEKSASALDPASRKSSQSVQQLGKSSDSTAGSINTLASTAMRLGGVIVAAFSVAAIKNYADAWSDMQSRVGAVTGDMEGAGDRMQRLVDIANASYAPLSQTAEVYSRNVATFRDLGRSADEAADFTEAVNNALVVTATRGEDAAVVVNSLSRALAIGKLDADAFDTIVSRSPRTLKAVADQMGVTTIELRKLATEGKVTSDVIATGLVGSLEQLQAEAAEMPATMGDAFVRVGNNVTEMVGRLDKATGASSALASGIIELADGMRSLTGDAESMNNVVTALEVASTALASVIAARLVNSLAASAIAMQQTIAAAKAKAAADLSAATAANRSAVVERDLANAELARARANVVAAEQQVASDRLVIASEVERLRSTAAAIAAEKALEVQRLQAQINDTGRAQSIARLAEIRLAEVAIIKQVEASEKSLAATTIATSAAVKAAYADRSAAAAAAAAATARANQTAQAVDATTAAVKSATVATGALATVARGASAAMAFLGGPLGVVLIAASALTYFAARATEAEKESEALDARINKLAGSFENLTVAQARSAIQDYSSKLADATFTMETAEAKAFTLRRNLEQFPNSKKAEEWARDLVTAEGAVDDAKGAVDEINESLRRLNELVERGGASKLGDDAEKASDAFSKLNRQLSERLAIAGKASEADRLAARIQGGFIEGLKEGEGEILIALQKQIDAREALTKTVTKGGSASDSAAKQIQGEISALERAAKVWGMTEGEVKIYDLTLKGASATQIEYARSLIATVEGLEAQKKAEEDARAAREQAGKAFETVSRDIGVSGTGISEIDQLNIQYEQRREVIAEALATEYLNQQRHDAAMIALDQTTAAARKAIMDEYTAGQQAQQLQSMAAIVSITQTQIAQMQGLFEEGSAIGKAFFVATQALAAANAVVQGFQSAMAIRVAYAQMAAMSGPGAPALLAAGEVHANVAQAMGFATAGMIVGQTVAGFQQGGYTGSMGVSDVAGVVHGREYVFDAAATSRIGVPTLEAIRSGRPLNSSGGISNGSGSDMSQPITIAPQVVVNGDPDKATIARIEKATADGAKLAYQQISNDLATGRGSVSKSLQAGYGVSRRKG